MSRLLSLSQVGNLFGKRATLSVKAVDCVGCGSGVLGEGTERGHGVLCGALSRAQDAILVSNTLPR
jgi:hypothetical protein